MTREHLIFNTIFYILLTLFFIYIFINEKKLVAKMEIKRKKLEDKIVEKCNIAGTVKEKIFRKISKFVESIGTALILVLIIQKFYLGNFLVPTGSMIPTIIPYDRLFANMVIYNFKAPQREDIVVFQEPIENKVLYTKRLMGLPGEKIQIKNEKLFVNGKEISSRQYLPLEEIYDREWVVPKKGDTITIIPGKNYNEFFEAKNIDIAKIQETLTKNSAYLSQILPDVKFQVNGVDTGMIMDYIHDKKILNKLLAGETVTLKLDEDCYFMLGDNTSGSYDSRMWGFVKEHRIKGKALVRFWPLTRIGLLK